MHPWTAAVLSAGATAIQRSSGHAAAAYEARQWKEIAETHARKHTYMLL